jgi:DNA replication protein DnaC
LDEISAILERIKQDSGQARSIGQTSQQVCRDTDFCVVSLTKDPDDCKYQENKDLCVLYRNVIAVKLERCGIYKRFRNSTFENIEKIGVPSAIQEQYEQILEYADNLKENLSEGRGLLLKGSVGTMKTTLAVAVLQQHIYSGGWGKFISMASLLDNIFGLKAKSKEEWAEYEREIKETPLLVLDDMGAEHTEGWVLTKVDAIISERWNRCRSIIITTNLSSEQLKATYAERVIDRLRNTMQVINFSGDSLRKPA